MCGERNVLNSANVHRVAGVFSELRVGQGEVGGWWSWMAASVLLLPTASVLGQHVPYTRMVSLWLDYQISFTYWTAVGLWNKQSAIGWRIQSSSLGPFLGPFIFSLYRVLAIRILCIHRHAHRFEVPKVVGAKARTWCACLLSLFSFFFLSRVCQAWLDLHGHASLARLPLLARKVWVWPGYLLRMCNYCGGSGSIA